MTRSSMPLAVAMLAGLLVVGLTARGEEEVRVANSPLATLGPTPRAIDAVDGDALRSAIRQGVEFLLDDQRPSGGWGSTEQTKGLNIYAPVPGAHHAFRAAVTGLVLEALVAVEPLETGPLAERIGQAIDQGELWMLQNTSQIRRADTDAVYNTWGHAYSITGMASLYHRAGGDESKKRALKAAIDEQVEKLQRYAFVNGGWGYYDFDYKTQVPGGSPNSFTTATALISLQQAQQLGIEISQKMVDKAIVSIQRQRNPDFTYAYGEYLMMRPMYPINRAGGSLGRSQACNLALRLYDDTRVTDKVLETWLNRLFARNGWLSIGRKRPVPHESHFAVAGYFYYYGHYYAAKTIPVLPKEDRPYFQDHLAAVLMPLQEADGSWWDYPFYNYHQQYGTAMAVTSLIECMQNVESSPSDAVTSGEPSGQ